MAVGHECSVKKEARLMKPTTINVTRKREEGEMGWQICLGVFLVVCVCVSIPSLHILLFCFSCISNYALSSLLSFPFYSIKKTLLLLLLIIAHLSQR